ncbi:hypothetical protein [Desulfosarcina variabilis]|uniref:hypothetical protein n=1 Tax=Desulfosarcina variabilis TaxID=2300 RepID=UPI003AFA6E92
MIVDKISSTAINFIRFKGIAWIVKASYAPRPPRPFQPALQMQPSIRWLETP